MAQKPDSVAPAHLELGDATKTPICSAESPAVPPPAYGSVVNNFATFKPDSIREDPKAQDELKTTFGFGAYKAESDDAAHSNALVFGLATDAAKAAEATKPKSTKHLTFGAYKVESDDESDSDEELSAETKAVLIEATAEFSAEKPREVFSFSAPKKPAAFGPGVYGDSGAPKPQVVRANQPAFGTKKPTGLPAFGGEKPVEKPRCLFTDLPAFGTKKLADKPASAEQAPKPTLQPLFEAVSGLNLRHHKLRPSLAKWTLTDAQMKTIIEALLAIVKSDSDDSDTDE